MTRFSPGRAGAVAARVLLQIRRDRRTLGMLVLVPVIIMLVFGFALGGTVSNVPILVDNQDSGSPHAGSLMVAALEKDSAVRVTLGDFAAGKAGVDSGAYFAAVLIPSNFSQTLAELSSGAKVTPSLQVYIDGTKPSIDEGVLGALQGSLVNATGVRAFNISEQYAFGGAKFTGLDVSIPSVMAFVLTFLVLLISLLTIARETIGGTLPRLYTTPLTALERLVGYAAALLVLSFLMVGVILVVGIGLFGAVVRGNLLLLLSAAVVYALAQVLLAAFLSNFAKNEFQAVQLAPLIALPSMALSGMLVPVYSLPAWIQPVAKIVPLYYGNRLLEGIMLKGYAVGQLETEFVVVGAMCVLFLALALTTVKDRMED